MAQDLRALVQRARTGDRAAFGQLVHKYQRRVYATAFRMTGSHADADDVSQEALIRAYRGLKGFNQESDFFTWLYRIVINVSLNHLRRSSRRRTLSIEDVTLPEPVEAQAGGDPRRALELKQLTADIGNAMGELPESLRATVVLVIFEGMPYREAAEILEISEGTVAWRVHEARRKLRGPLGKYLKAKTRSSGQKQRPSAESATSDEATDEDSAGDTAAGQKTESRTNKSESSDTRRAGSDR